MLANWELLIDEAALASVLPEQYARFARPVRDALAIFLQGLPAEDQAAILAAQAALPAGATFAQRLGRLAQCCPVLHKLGQVLARDARLPAELRAELQQLESLPPSVPWELLRQTLVRELGPLEPQGIHLMRPALAEASVAVVVPFECSHHAGDRHDSATRYGVFKILKPGIEQRMACELQLLARVGAHLDQRCEQLGIPQLDYEDSFAQVRESLAGEVRLDLEQEHLRQAAAIYRGQRQVQIPALMPQWSTPRITAMQRIWGGKVTEHPYDAMSQRRQVAERTILSLVAQPVFARTRQAMFHSDPHAGNLFLTDDRRLAILDWSLVGRLGQRQREAVVQILLGALTLHGQRIAEVLEGLAQRHSVLRPELHAVVQRHLRLVRRGRFPGLTWLVGMLDEAVHKARLRVAPDLMMFRKSLLTLEGVVTEIGAGRSWMDEVLCREFLCHFTAEWPSRWLTLPHSREFATRLSNRDLAQVVLGMPWTASRFWLGHVMDLLGSCRAPG
ncbi:MAG: phosphotransferase [Pirellulaceae bacterium]|nr:phosphotransferase [Pirellulaceae bacterium]